MALSAIQTVREAELQSKKRIEDAEKESQEMILAAEKEASEIVLKAEEKAKLQLIHKEEKAGKTADEIMVTKHNASVVAAATLRRSCAEKQDVVNKRILEIIKNS